MSRKKRRTKVRKNNLKNRLRIAETHAELSAAQNRVLNENLQSAQAKIDAIEHSLRNTCAAPPAHVPPRVEIRLSCESGSIVNVYNA